MYLIILFILLVVSIAIFYANTQEGFTSNFQDILPITIEAGNETISVPNNLKGNKDNYIAFEGDVRVKRANCIEFGRGEKPQAESGKIGCNQNSVYIKGWGTDPAKLSISLQSNVTVTNNLSVGEEVTCKTVNIRSDDRIKHNKSELSSSSSLDKIRLLNPSQYQYKNGDKTVYGFIAQEVQSVIPTCVTSQKSYIANIYDSAILSGSTLTFKHFNTTDLAYKGAILYPKLQIRLDGQEEYVTIDQILDKHTLRIQETPIQGEVLVYGQEVDDFLTIDKNQLFTVTTSALQELDHQLQEEREKNKVVLHRILQRLSILELK